MHAITVGRINFINLLNKLNVEFPAKGILEFEIFVAHAMTVYIICYLQIHILTESLLASCLLPGGTWMLW